MINKLNEKPDKNPYRVPEGYFEEVNKNILSVTSGNGTVVRKTGFYFRIKPAFLAAASIAGFIILSYTAIKLLTPDRIVTKESEVIFEEYYTPYMNEIDTYSLEENAASLFVPEAGPDVRNTDIIDYLLLENIEISEIYEQL